MKVIICRGLEKVCNDEKQAQRKLGSGCAKELMLRLTELRAAESLQDIFALVRPRLHWLKGNLNGLLAVDLEHPKRLILEPLESESQDLKEIKAVMIKEIKDYH